MKDNKNIIKITQELDTKVLNNITENVKYNAIHDSFYFDSDSVIHFDTNEVYPGLRYSKLIKETLKQYENNKTIHK